MFGWIKNIFGGNSAAQLASEKRARERLQAQFYVTTERYQRIKSSYDAAQTSDETTKHWAAADLLSSRAANRLYIRIILRRRSRYEVANNCHARGITLTMANDLIGTGPRLQCLFDDEGICDLIETCWREWAEAVNLDEKLHTFALATIVDGEAFGLLINNPTLQTPVQLDMRLVECDQISTPYGAWLGPGQVDGITFDRYNQPKLYHYLIVHPGDLGMSSALDTLKWRKIPARNMLHWFRPDRPDQARGIPEITPALPLFAQLRRYTLSTLMAAEVAADFSTFIQTENPPAEDEPMPHGFSSTDLEKGMITALPSGYKAFQMQAAQPTATHDTFTRTLLTEACHCLNIPYNIATADFTHDSYAGGRMAQGVYQRSVEVRRRHFQYRVLDRLFAAWLQEAVLTDPRLLGKIPATIQAIPHTWFFDEWTHVDPGKEANATQTELVTNTTTLADEYAKKGQDWRKQIRQRGREIAMLAAEGALILPPGTPPLDGSQPVGSTPPAGLPAVPDEGQEVPPDNVAGRRNGKHRVG